MDVAQDIPIRIDTSLDRVTDWMDDVVRTAPLVEKRGRVSGVTGGLIRATVAGVRIADLCRLKSPGDRGSGEDALADPKKSFNNRPRLRWPNSTRKS